MKKVFVWLLAGLFLSVSVCSAQPQPVCSAAVLIDADTGRVLWGMNEDEPLPMASTTKIMTALLTLENSGLDEIVTIPELASGIPGTSIYLSAGETLTVHELLQGLLLRSGNDAATALAHYVGGGVTEFVSMMNRRADELGVDATFANPHGLDADGHAASARAMALIAREAMKIPAFAEIVSTQRAVIPWDGNEYNRVLQTKNRLLWEYEGASGIKTGYTGRAGRCLVFSAQRDGVELIGVVLNCGNWFEEAKNILDWGFERYHRVEPLARGDPAGEITVDQMPLPVQAGENVQITTSPQERLEILLQPLEGLKAPVESGQKVGYGYVMIDGQARSRFELLAAEDLESRRFGHCVLRALENWPVLS